MAELPQPCGVLQPKQFSRARPLSSSLPCRLVMNRFGAVSRPVNATLRVVLPPLQDDAARSTFLAGIATSASSVRMNGFPCSCVDCVCLTAPAL